MEKLRRQSFETALEQPIDLSHVSVRFIDDKTIDRHYVKKASKIADPQKWYDMNRNALENEKPALEKMVADGILPDTRPESLCRYLQNRLASEKTEAERLRDAVKERHQEILRAAASRLSEFIPSWKPEKASLFFTLDERADFRVDGTKITADLGRLAHAKNWLETATAGITHEIFHIWMQEGDDWSDAEMDKATTDKLKKHIVFKTVDEGLAVLVSRQKLSEHHKKSGREYPAYIDQAFQAFRTFLREKHRQRIEKTYKEAFENMGRFYVVGNEMAKAVLQSIGPDEFRALIQESRRDSVKLIEQYILNTDDPKLSPEDLALLQH